MRRIAILLGVLFWALAIGWAVSGPTYLESGKASYYAAHYEGKPTASGELFRAHKLTGASWTFYGCDVRVTNRRTGKSVQVRINDRGPSRRFPDRVVDLSPAAFRLISSDGTLREGLLDVEVVPLRRFQSHRAD